MDNTREKLIDIVEYYADFLDWDTKEDMVDGIMEFLATDNNVGDKSSPSDKDNNVPTKWIPVTERLPRNDTYILVSTDCVVIPAYWHNDRFYSFTAIGIATVGGVTHWMPLPQPPKGE